MFGKVLWISSFCVLTACAKPQQSSLNQARNICLQQGFKIGTEKYSACILFEEARIADEIIKKARNKKLKTKHQLKYVTNLQLSFE